MDFVCDATARADLFLRDSILSFPIQSSCVTRSGPSSPFSCCAARQCCEHGGAHISACRFPSGGSSDVVLLVELLLRALIHPDNRPRILKCAFVSGRARESPIIRRRQRGVSSSQFSDYLENAVLNAARRASVIFSSSNFYSCRRANAFSLSK